MPLSPLRTLRIPSEYALSFDGVDDYVEVPHSSSLYLDKDFTVLAWVTLERTPPTWNGIIDKGWISYSDFWLLSDRGYNRLRWGIGFTDNTSVEILFPLVNLKEWNFYAFGVEGSSMFMSFNGGAKAYYTFTKTRKIGTLKLTLGCRNYISYFENVKIDGICIYSRALSQDEILWNYNYPFNPVRNGLVLWLPGTDEAIQPPTWYDKSVFGNNGTIYGALKTQLVRKTIRTLTATRVLASAR